ncbi:MAG: hypothetical protein M3N95_18055 [Actinomycetota bacterium]|nr:hypothetical protein [Actinomycetota bacterium]
MSAISGAHGSSSLLFYAADPGAFVDLAADLSFALGLELSDLVLDRHLTLPRHGEGIDGFEFWSGINQAVGVLIARGHTPESARTELHRLADSDSGNLHDAARAVLARVINSALPD